MRSRQRRTVELTRVLLIIIIVTGLLGLNLASAKVLHVPRHFDTIQDAVDAAGSGDIIQVAPGTYVEQLVIQTPQVQLKGRHAIVDGLPLGGDGIGFHVLGTAGNPIFGVTIMGFIVENWERGLVLEHAMHSRVHNNVVKNNTDKNPGDGLFNTADGVVLRDSHFNIVSQNHANENGHNGIFLIEGSSGNVLRGNRANDNGAQTGAAVAGCGIQLSSGANNHNQIVANETNRNAWGILLGPGGNPSGNFIGQNRSHENRRAGIAMRGDADGNFILQNNATGNGLLNLPPSLDVDLFEGSTGTNIWLRNKGTTNF